MTTLLLIDVQNDFHPGGSLAIPTADTDATRTASFIRKHMSSISRIVMTMASNQTLHTFNSGFWTNGETGEHPSPFTTITSDDVKNGTWVPRGDIRQGGKGGPMIDDAIFAKGGDIPSNLYNEDGSVNILQFCIEYTSRLESKGRFQLCIWPKHCLIGTSGHNVVPEVMEAVLDWSHETGGIVEWVDKGQNLFTEMYSAFCAEVPLNGKTDFDQDLFSSSHLLIIY